MHIAHTHNLRSISLQFITEIAQFDKTDLSLSCLFCGVLYSMYNYTYNFLSTLVNDVCISTYTIGRFPVCPKTAKPSAFFRTKKQKKISFSALSNRYLWHKCISMLLISIVFLAQKRTLGEENPPEAMLV
jgi:hypothetical protein